MGISNHQSLSCGAFDCELDRSAHAADAGMDFLRCPACGVLRLPPEKLLYSSVLPDPVGKLSAVMKLLMLMRMRWLTAELPRLAEKNSRIVDIGCGDGQFLEFLKSLGYGQIVGVETDTLRAAHAKKRGVQVFATSQAAESAGIIGGGADFLFIWHVLEHIERPVDFIGLYVCWLAPAGSMIISVPNQASLQTRLFGYFSAYPDYGRHIWYHKASYLKRIAQSAPEMNATILHDRNYEYEIFSWVDSIASAITRQQNFILRAVKKGEGSMTRRAFALLLAACLLPFALPLSILSIHFGNPSTLTFVLRKR
jgi:2-polyprenyl-3-methyl-5-hydroxy-6-metoxy-1,4-benzoquinol methylase